MKNLKLLAIALMSLAAATAAGAQTLNCNRDFAQQDDSKATLLQKCGEPVFKDSFCKGPAPNVQLLAAPEPVRPGFSGCETVEEWTYNPGSGQFMTMVQFENGVLKSIRYGNRIP